jgi:hypothetical protein
MVMNYLAFRLPAEEAALVAAVRAVSAVPEAATASFVTEPVVTMGDIAAVVDTAVDAGEIDNTPAPSPAAPVKRGRGRPAKAAAPAAPGNGADHVEAAPVEAPQAAPVASEEALAALRADLDYEALRVARLTSVPAMRSILQGAAGEGIIHALDVPDELLGQALAAMRAAP